MEIKYYQIDEVAKLTGITKRTIRYYEDLELLKPARSDSSYRLYTEDNIDTINEVKNLRIKLGMNLSQIKRFMGLKKMVSDILEVGERDTAKINETEDRIKELMVFIDEREEVLERIKKNCCSYLDKLNKAAQGLEANKNEER